MRDARDRVILALDVPTLDQAERLAGSCGDDLRWVKVGLELYTAEGPRAVTAFKDRGLRVFLDLKLHDIPNTVAGAVRSAVVLGADLLTVHATGGRAMLRAALEARGDYREDGLRLLAVTVLTSIEGGEFHPEIYASKDVRERVVFLANTAECVGLDGIVCSAGELAFLRQVSTPGFLRVAPGIRTAGAGTDDQARVATPAAAVLSGATHMVVGRAVTAAPEPGRALRAILDEVEDALAPGR